MSASWKESILRGSAADGLPEGYGRRDEVVGRAEILDQTDRSVWSGSEFVARSRTPHTTSAIEAVIRRRHLERLVERNRIDTRAPILDLGCADGLLARDLLDLGSEKLVSTDILPELVATLNRSLAADQRERVLLLVDDMLTLPLAEASFGTVFAWGILSVSGDFPGALARAWKWVASGGHLLLAEPILESVLAYTLVRSDLDEFRRTLEERTRAAMWDTREDRYPVRPLAFYREQIEGLADATIVEAGGISMLPSLVHGGLMQESPIDDAGREQLTALLSDPELDELYLWRQAYWLIRKR